MAKKAGRKKHPGRRGSATSLRPLTTDQVISALLKVKLSDVKKLAVEEKAGKKK